MVSDVFRPRLPLNPFIHQRPWIVNPKFKSQRAATPTVILVLGANTESDLLPFQSLTHSLLIVASHHAIPDLFSSLVKGPVVRVLRLPAPLALEDAGALRLVSILERAHLIASQWRENPASFSPRVLHLAEQTPGGPFTIVIDPSQHSLPVSSSPSNRPLSTLVRPKSPISEQRSFDALINFLPANVPDKLLLKHAILTTSLSHHFLTADTSPHEGHGLEHGVAQPSTPKKSTRLSFFSSSPPIRPVSLNNIDPQQGRLVNNNSRAHVLHVLPRGYTSFPNHRPSSLSSSSSPGSSSASSCHSLPPIQQQHSSTSLLINHHHHQQQHQHQHQQHLLQIPQTTPPKARNNVFDGVINPNKPKLVQSIEHFLLSFAYPLPKFRTSSSTSSSPPRSPPSTKRRSYNPHSPQPRPLPQQHSLPSRLRRDVSGGGYEDGSEGSEASLPSSQSASSTSLSSPPRAKLGNARRTSYGGVYRAPLPSPSAFSRQSSPSLMQQHGAQLRPVSMGSEAKQKGQLGLVEFAAAAMEEEELVGRGRGGGKGRRVKVVPFVMPAEALTDIVTKVLLRRSDGCDVERAVTLGEFVLGGHLDEAADGTNGPRAWVLGVGEGEGEIWVVGQDDSREPSEAGDVLMKSSSKKGDGVVGPGETDGGGDEHAAGVGGGEDFMDIPTPPESVESAQSAGSSQKVASEVGQRSSGERSVSVGDQDLHRVKDIDDKPLPPPLHLESPKRTLNPVRWRFWKSIRGRAG